MNRYIDSEKLKAEVKRLKGELMYGSCSALIQVETNCKNEAYNEILSCIDSLQQEQPEVDLEKEIDKFLNVTGAPYVWCNDDEQKEWCNTIARHFYELGLNARKEE